MSSDAVSKVTAARLSRDAYLYIRQSTLHQVVNNTESTARQYDLRGRALTLGWPAERIHVIDIDQGHSGASAADRQGFQHLVAEVSLGRAGIVLGLECSRLARDSADWQQLIKICAHNDTLICDEDGLYDPASFNDRLLLGLKGTMAESELHFLRARMQGGLLAKARRGELKLRLPAGLVYDAAGIIMLDPDTGVRGALQLLLDTFTATGSARAVVAAFNAAHLTFPGRHLGGPHAGELYFKPLTHDQVLDVLHNPAYAGAYVYGRSKTSTDLDGRVHSHLKPVTGWTVLIRDHHPGYLTWAQYERNQAVLTANAASRGEDRTAGPAREGCALLQGVVICGRCGLRMTVGYHTLADRTRVPAYHCQRAGIQKARRACQAITGASIDAAISALICDTLTPLALQTALAVTAELAADARKADTVRAAHVQRAQNAADTAGRRYLSVDPANRLVAGTLEADWNTRLRELADARDHYARARDTDAALDEQQQARVLALAGDFPALWNNPATPMRERKRLLRLLITDVTLTRDSDGDGAIRCQVRFTGGQHHILTLPRPLTAAEQHTTSPATVDLISQLLDDHPFDEIAAILNNRGITGGWGRAFTVHNLAALCRARGLSTHADRVRASGMLTISEIAADLQVTPQTIGKWHRRGLITGQRTSGRGECLFHPGQHRPGPAEQTAARRPAGTRHLLTSRQLASSLGVTPSTILRWTQLGLLTAAATGNRGFSLYQPGQPRPTRDQITTACRPPGTGNAITGGQLAARHGVSRSAVYKWHQLGLIGSLGTDGTGRNLYHPGQQAPSPQQIRTARAARRHGTAECQTPVPSSVPEGRTPPVTTTGTGSSTRGAV
jgi:DNA invertase Pin-like site-specific DNA recombinase/DNA-binding transcriptional MerR regulator